MGFPAVLMLAGTAMSAAGAAKEGEATKDAAQANARLSAMDAANEAYRIERTADMVQSENIVRTAKSGVTMSGSPLDVLAFNAAEAQRQRVAIMRSQHALAGILYQQGQAAVEASRWAVAGGVMRGVGGLFGGSAGELGTWGNTTAGAPSGYGRSLGISQPSFNWFPKLPGGG